MLTSKQVYVGALVVRINSSEFLDGNPNIGRVTSVSSEHFTVFYFYANMAVPYSHNNYNLFETVEP